MITCPICSYENTEEEQICVRCGELLVEGAVSTRTFDDTDYEEGVPKWGSARFNGSMNLVLDVLEQEEPTRFVFDADKIEEVIIGRQDPNTGKAPPIDLTANGGLNQGVSRQHAIILRKDGALHIMDNESANGTFLNGQKLVAKQPRILRDGDDIRFGHLVLRVTFQPGLVETKPASSPKQSSDKQEPETKEMNPVPGDNDQNED